MISIIIPTYRPDYYLFESLAKLSKQTLSKNEFEVLIVLNGDKEPFFIKLKSYLRELTFNCRLIYTSMKGVSNARNIGIEESLGDYIVFLDDDDLLSDNFLEELYEECSFKSIKIANFKNFDVSIDYPYDDYLTKSFTANCKNKKLNLLKIRSHFSSACGKLIPKEIIGYRRFNNKLEQGEDSIFMISLSDKIKNVNFTREDAIYYRRVRRDSVSNRERSFFYELGTLIKFQKALFILFFSAPLKYNLLFFMVKAMANFKRFYFSLNKAYN